MARQLPDSPLFELAEDESYVSECSEHGDLQWEIQDPFMRVQPGYLYGYSRGSAALHIHFGVLQLAVDDGETEDLCAIIEKVVRAEGMSGMRNTPNAEAECGSAKSGANGDHLTVLIRVIENTEYAEDITLGTTAIRLNLSDHCPNSEVHATDGQQITFPRVAVAIYKFASGVQGERVLRRDGEASRFPVLLRRACNGHVIERAAEIMYEVAKHHDDHRIRRIEGKAILPDTALTLWLSDTTDRVRLAIGVRSNCVPDFYHVALCSLEFEPPGVRHEVNSDYGLQEDTEKAEGVGDTRSHAARVLRELEEDGKAAETLNSPPPEEVASRKSPGRRRGGSTAKRTRLGSPEDA